MKQKTLAVPLSLKERVMAMYPEELDKLITGINHAIETMPFHGESPSIKCSIQLHIPVDVWQVVVEHYAFFNWTLKKETEEHNIHNLVITHIKLKDFVKTADTSPTPESLFHSNPKKTEALRSLIAHCDSELKAAVWDEDAAGYLVVSNDLIGLSTETFAALAQHYTKSGWMIGVRFVSLIFKPL
ncbi:hypothetical protein PHABIO_417 [Pseudomonas phage Phabio]|uniref:Uncharacterized protein n=1 Tax=Pseudomonas phage Phabio TaxID=2006668 RepID=A0A1Y0T0M7_9CAUD|nr:hypothetical protein MZD05_gp417 [Pseudomonas phage Phabio]ARV77048.1 hypothetical protein PHABIO_417 [Pseudomonas phage Phabio]